MILPRTTPERTMYSPLAKRLHLGRAYFGGSPIWATWQVTYRCNFRCDFCDYWRFDGLTAPSNVGGRHVETERETTVAEFAEGSRRLAQMGSLLVSLAGGEPMVRRDIVDVVREVSRYHLTFITTNGWLVTRENARAMFEAGLWGASVSIDYADAARHDERRGVAGSWERAVEALRCFSEERVARHQRVNLQAVLLDDNLDEMGPLAELAARHNANFMVQPYSTLKTGEREHISRRPAARRLLELKPQHPNFLSNPLFLSKFDHALNGGVPGCKCGRAFFNIDQFGNVARCVEFRHQPVGNLLTDNLNRLERRLREAGRENTCQRCWYNCRGEIESAFTLHGLMHALPTYLYGVLARIGPK